MKQLIVLCGEHCAYCKKAKMLIRRALVNTPEFTALDIQYICEEDIGSAQYPHTFVPAFFVDGECVLEGNPNMDDIVAILKKCSE